MFLTYNYCAKWPLRIVRMVQNLCEKSFIQNAGSHFFKFDNVMIVLHSVEG